MKKLLTLLVCVLTVFSLTACGNTANTTPAEDEYDYAAKSEGVMTYEEYAAAEVGSTVTIEAYVQGAQSYWGGARLYLEDPDGGYFVYANTDIAANISEEDYAKLGLAVDAGESWIGLANGQKVRVTGVKDEWAGEVEITGNTDVASTVEVIEEGVTWVAEAKAITLDENPEQYINQYVSIEGLTVVENQWNGEDDDADIYYVVEDGDAHQFTFCVESYLCYPGTQAYETAKTLQAGDVITVEGFLYWYENPQLHTTSIVVNQ